MVDWSLYKTIARSNLQIDSKLSFASYESKSIALYIHVLDAIVTFRNLLPYCIEGTVSSNAIENFLGQPLLWSMTSPLNGCCQEVQPYGLSRPKSIAHFNSEA